jgi:hypothetical protein
LVELFRYALHRREHAVRKRGSEVNSGVIRPERLRLDVSPEDLQIAADDDFEQVRLKVTKELLGKAIGVLRRETREAPVYELANCPRARMARAS